MPESFELSQIGINLYVENEVEWLKEHPTVILLSIIASLITIVGAVWTCAKRVPQFKGFLSHISFGREKKWMPCRYCKSEGKYVKQKSFAGTVYETCPFCKGHGEIYTALWSQPDCNYCDGTGMVVTKQSFEGKEMQNCHVCSGYGKRPFW